MPRLFLLAATANAWVLILILLMAFVVQIAAGEPPCPLCVLQRIAMMMCALGPLYLLIGQRRGEILSRDVAVAGGIGIAAGLLGVAASTRQVLLHILPNDPGFGSPVLGLHLYTWCLIAFLAHIAANALMLIGAAWLPEKQMKPWPLTRATAGALAIIAVANIVSVILEAGIAWDLPSDPTGYLLLK
jgi:disulfide bond formation protein DsbB